MTLEHDFLCLLARLELLPYGPITNYNPSGGHAAPDTKAPTGDSRPAHDVFRDRWNKAVSTRAKEAVIAAAQDELQAWTAAGRRPKQTEESTEDRDKRMIMEGEGWSPKEVALKFNCTPKYVEKTRRSAGVPTDTGKRPVIQKDADMEVEIRSLIDRGLSERQIRMFTGAGGSKIAKVRQAA